MSQIIYVCAVCCVWVICTLIPKVEVHHVSSSTCMLVLKGVPLVNLSSSQSYNFQ